MVWTVFILEHTGSISELSSNSVGDNWSRTELLTERPVKRPFFKGAKMRACI